MKSRPYIEPIIRTVAGVLVTIFAIFLYLQNEAGAVWFILLLVVSLNLFQSGLTDFCLLEKFLQHFGFRSELTVIRQLRQKEQAAAARQANYIRTFDLLSEAIIEFSQTGKILTVSEGWWALLGSDELVCPISKGRQMVEFVHPDDVEMIDDIFQEFTKADHSVGLKIIRFRIQRKDGEDNWVEGKFVRIHDLAGSLTIQGVLRDVTESHLQEEKNQYLALHDALTGLPNRLLFNDRLNHSLSAARRNKHLTGILYIDIDNFKTVNDVHGHKAGDEILVAVSSILQSCIRESDTLARIGGDEFILLLPYIESRQALQHIGDNLLLKLEHGFIDRELDRRVTLSIGGAVYDESTDTADALLDKADTALYQVKNNGRNNVRLYTEDKEQNRVLN